MRIGFIGLGNMGLPMARNLLAAGHELYVYNRSPAKAAPLVAQGAVQQDSPAAVGQAVELVVSMLSADDAVRSVLAGDDGLAGSLAASGIHVSLSTIAPETAQWAAEQHDRYGERFVAGAVFGRPDAAEAAKLWVCISGHAPDKSAVRPALETLGQGIFDVGDAYGDVSCVKLAGNFMIAAALEAMGEAFTLIEKTGLDRERFAEVMSQSLFNCPVYKNYGAAIARREHEPALFALGLGRKDMGLVQRLAAEHKVPLPLAHVLHDRLTAAVAKGRTDLDWSALALGVSEDAGRNSGKSEG